MSIAQAFGERLPAQLQLPMKRASQFAGPDVLPALLKRCGAGQTTTELFAFDMKFSEFQEIWTLVQDSGVLDAQLGSLSANEQLAVRKDLEKQLAGFKHNGGYLVPHSCRLVWGQ